MLLLIQMVCTVVTAVLSSVASIDVPVLHGYTNDYIASTAIHCSVVVYHLLILQLCRLHIHYACCRFMGCSQQSLCLMKND
jgi:hypothetical protein